MNIQTLKVTVKSEGISQTAQQIKNLGAVADTTEQKVQKLVQAVNSMAKQFAAGASGTKAMADALAATQKTTQASDAAMKSLATSIGESAVASKAMAQSTGLLIKELGILNARLQQGSVNVNNNTKHIVHHTAAMSEAHSAARGLTGALGALWLTYGNVAPLAAGAAIGASLKAVVVIGADVENTLEAIRLKGEATVQEMKEMGKAVAEIGQGIYGPQQVAEAFQTLVLAGLKAKEAVTAVGAALNLATSGGTTIEKSAEALVTIGTAVGATAKEYDYLADGIQKAANISLASVDSIAESVKRASVVNKLYGASFEDILTQTAALAQLGIKNSAAGTAITNFYANALGGTEKAKKALDALGFSFQDATGKAKPLVEAYEEFTAKLNQFDLKSQQKIITDIFGERALRDVEGLRDQVNSLANDTSKYANKLRETQGEIANAAGTSAVLAAQQAMTTENQFKSVANTLKSAFLDAFDSVGPAANNIAKTLKQLFASDEFKTGLNNLVSGFGKLAELLANNIPLITAVAEGFLAVSIASAGGALFARMIPAIQGLAVAFGAVAVAANGAAVATGLFGTAIKMLPGIGIVLGLATAAYALYSLHADKAAKSTKELAEEKRKLAEEYSGDLFANLDKEIVRLEMVNEQLDKGVELTEAQAKANTKLAMSKLRATNEDAVNAAQKAVDDAKKDPALYSYIGQLEAIKKLRAAQADLAAAKKKMQDDDEAFAKRQEKFEMLSGFQKSILAARTLGKELEAEGKAGVKSFEEQDKSLKSQLSFLEQENLALRKATLGYQARTKAVIESYTSGEKAMAGAHQAAVEANKLEGKYANDRIYREQLAKAAAADSAKLELDRQQIYGEVSQKINDIIKAEEERQKMAGNGQVFNSLRRELEAAAGYTKISEKQLEIDRARAEQAEKIRIANDNRKKIESATGNSLQRAEQYVDEFATIEKYGLVAKQTAVEFAKAELAKRGFLESSPEGMDRMGAAGLEDLNKALLSLQKTYSGLKEWQTSQGNQMLESILGVESAKVEIYKNTAEKAIEFEKARGIAAIEAQKAAGKITEEQAKSELEKLTAQFTRVKSLLGEKLTIDFKIAGLKDISTIFDRLADNAGKLGKGFSGATKALGGYSTAFKTIAQAEKEHGKNESKMQAARIGFYGDLSEASKNFFSENTAAYKTLDGVAKIFHAAQLARDIAATASGVMAGAAQMFGQAGFGGFAGVAAMGAVMAGLGYVVGGGLSGGSGGQSAASVQKSQGTGSIFGDGDAKSESISRSLSYLEKNSNLMLPLTQGMLSALKNIEASLSGLANLVVRADGITSGTNMGIQTGKMGGNGMNFLQNTLMGTNTLGGAAGGGLVGLVLGGPIGAAIGSVLGGVVGNALGKLWGSTKQTIVDSGIMFGGKVSNLQQGQGFNQYASIDTTKKSWFGLSKKTTNRVETQGLDQDLANQFGLIFTNLEDALKLAAGGFGKTGKEVGDIISNVVLEETKLSLKDLKGEELTAAINAVISKAMDDIAEAAFPGLNDFRKVGEGYSETVLRVASGIEQANVALEQFNIAAINYVDIVNKQGDVAAEIFKQSVLAVEQFNGVRDIVKNLTGDISELSGTYKQLKDIQGQLTGAGLNGGNLSLDTIKGAGGLEELQEGLENYFNSILTEEQQLAAKTAELTKQFNLLGLAVPDSNQAFADLIKRADDGTAAGNKLVGQLLILAQSFDEVGDATLSLAEQQKEYAMRGVEQAFEALKRSIGARKDVLKEEYDAEVSRIKAIAKAKKEIAEAELKIAKENLAAITDIANKLGSALGSVKIESGPINMLRRESAIGYLKSIRGTDLTKAAGLDSALSDIGKPSEQMFGTFEDFARDQARAAEAINGLKNQADIQKSFAELTIERLDATIEAIEASMEAQLEAAQARFETEMEKLDAQLEAAQAQIDALNNINNSVLSLSQAMSNFAGAVANFKAVQIGHSGGGGFNPAMAIESLYGNLLGRKSDAPGLQSWLKAYSLGQSIESITKGFLNSDEYKSLYPSFDVGTNFVTEDTPAMVHKGERIMPAADNAELMRRLDVESSSLDMQALERKLDSIREAIVAGDIANVQQTRETTRILKRFDQDGLPPERDVS